ncbi:calcium-binding protein [Oryzibacter oryziterrae]|uniref:calcium-binding protein n=1 Tax=Oryzibacter oryziterrae TaxID=2766474 RepID=UPI001F02154E|nr:calcium-binding protein [Oryzibacter oryziterrae]
MKLFPFHLAMFVLFAFNASAECRYGISLPMIVGDCEVIDGKRVYRAQEDHLVGTNSREDLDGGTLNDRIEGLGGNDQLFGGSGDDILSGGAGSDDLDGGEGNDVLIAGPPGSGVVDGRFIGDMLYPGPGDDRLTGSSGDDSLNLSASFKASGSDIGHAGAGNDEVRDGTKADTIWLDAGDDRVLDQPAGLPDHWYGGAGFDEFYFTGSPVAVDLTANPPVGPNGDIIKGFERFVLTPFSDTFTVSYDVSDTTRDFGAPLHSLEILTYDTPKDDTVLDHIVVKDGTGSRQGGGALIILPIGPVDVTTGSRSDSIIFGQGTVHAGAGADFVSIVGFSDATVFGEAGDDEIDGGLGKATIIGGQGADAINCGSIDNETDNGAVDIVRYENASESTVKKTDVISHFNPKQDKIDLSQLDADAIHGGRQPFKLVSKFTGKPGQLLVKLNKLSSLQSSILLKGDINGDRRVDFLVSISNAKGSFLQVPPSEFIVLK